MNTYYSLVHTQDNVVRDLCTSEGKIILFERKDTVGVALSEMIDPGTCRVVQHTLDLFALSCDDSDESVYCVCSVSPDEWHYRERVALSPTFS